MCVRKKERKRETLSELDIEKERTRKRKRDKELKLGRDTERKDKTSKINCEFLYFFFQSSFIYYIFLNLPLSFYISIDYIYKNHISFSECIYHSLSYSPIFSLSHYLSLSLFIYLYIYL